MKTKKEIILAIALIVNLHLYCQITQQLIPASGSVGQYEKIEFGVDVGPTIQLSIDHFFGSDASGHVGWGHDYSLDGINPYDPDMISIEATFKYLDASIPDQQIYGFYYRQYQYANLGSSGSVTSTTTWEQVATPYHFRVRFAPTRTGNWQVTFAYRLNNGSAVPIGPAMKFSCVSSSNKGFVKLGSNNKFFEFSNGEPFFPVGRCEGFPRPEVYDGDHLKYRPMEYTDHIAAIKQIGDNGGNYTKVCVTEYSYSIEWEKLGVYDANPVYPLDEVHPFGTNRQALLWEFDNLLDMAHNNNIYIHLSMECGEGLTNYPGNAGYDLSWDHNPYKQNNLNGGPGIPNINYIDDLFDTGKDAFHVFKKRTRYMIARWGHSTNISSFELLNEADKTLNQPTIRDGSSAISTTMYNNVHGSGDLFTNWHNEVSTYIKQNIGLGHTNHLLSACWGGHNANSYWPIGSLPNIDFTNRHPYTYQSGQLQAMWGDTRFFDDVTLGGFPKPCALTEFGAAPGPCGFLIDNVPASPEFHNGLWGSSFMGSPCAGLEWWNTAISSYAPHIKVVKEFFSNIRLDAGNFVPRRYPDITPLPSGPADLIESYMLVNNNAVNATEVLGWVRNRSYWWYNLMASNCTYSSQAIVDAYANASCDGVHTLTVAMPSTTVCPSDVPASNIVINGVLVNTNYGIEWYNTTTGALIKTDMATSSGSTLTITTPTMSGSNQDYAYKIRRFYGPCSPNDFLEIANVDGGTNKKALMLNNRCNQVNGAVRTINMTNTNQTWIDHGIDKFDGWMDSNDKLFVGNINADNADELILVNTTYSSGAIRAVNFTTGANLAWIDHGTFNGWMDPTDKMFFGDVNNDNKSDLVLVNTGMSGGAIRAVEVLTGGNLSWINHGTFNTWMDATDKMFLADVDGNGKKDIVLVNTSLTGGALRAIDLTTGNDVYNVINHGTFAGWMDSSDKMFMGDVNNDSREDLILVNTSYNSGAIRVIDIATGGNLFYINHTGQFTYWMDANDKMLLADVNGDSKKDLVFANSDYTHGYLRAYNITTSSDIGQLNTGGPYTGWFDCSDRMLVGDLIGNGNNDIIMVNADYNNGAFLICDISTSPNSPVTKWHTDYAVSLGGWKDGIDNNSLYQCPRSRLANPGENEDEIIQLDNLNKNITVSPNPTTGLISLTGTGPGMQIAIFNTMGVQVMSEIANDKSTNINCSSLNNGIYFVQISDGASTQYAKIIIEK